MARGRVFATNPFKMAVILAFKRSGMTHVEFGEWLKNQTDQPFSGFRIRAWEKDFDAKFSNQEKLETAKIHLLRLLTWCKDTLTYEVSQNTIKGKDVKFNRQKPPRKNRRKPIPTFQDEPKFFF